MAEGNLGPGGEEGRNGDPLDEEAAWAAIVAGYGEEPPDPGPSSFEGGRDANDSRHQSEPGGAEGAARSAPAAGTTEAAGPTESTGPGETTGAADAPGSADTSPGEAGSRDASHGPEIRPDEQQAPLGGAPGLGPRDRPLGSSITGFAIGVGPRDWSPPDDEDEGHFEPPEPPPLPETDPTTTFAWLGALGGPLLLMATVLFQWNMTWWIATLGIGGFLGGFATLVMRMRQGDEEDDDPGRGAVV